VLPSYADDLDLQALVQVVFAPEPLFPGLPCKQPEDPTLVRQLLDHAPRPGQIGIDDLDRPLRADEVAEIWGTPMEGPDTRRAWLRRADEVARAWGKPLFGPGGLLPDATLEEVTEPGTAGAGQPDEVDTLLTHIATAAIDNPAAAGERLADWIGREPTPTGEARLHQLAHVVPRLLANALVRGNEVTRPDMNGPGATIPPATPDLAAMHAVAWHLASDPAAADALVDAFASRHNGMRGLWDIGFAALQLLTQELRDQRHDTGS